MARSKKSKEDLIESALLLMAIGSALGSVLTGKSRNTIAAAIAGAAIGASLKAIEEAKEISTPVMYEENGKIYKVYSDGKKEYVKTIKKSKVKVPSTFSIA